MRLYKGHLLPHFRPKYRRPDINPARAAETWIWLHWGPDGASTTLLPKLEEENKLSTDFVKNANKLEMVMTEKTEGKEKR